MGFGCVLVSWDFQEAEVNTRPNEFGPWHGEFNSGDVTNLSAPKRLRSKKEVAYTFPRFLKLRSALNNIVHLTKACTRMFNKFISIKTNLNIMPNGIDQDVHGNITND